MTIVVISAIALSWLYIPFPFQFLFFTILFVIYIIISLRHKRLGSILDKVKSHLSMSRTDLARLELDWEHIPAAPVGVACDHPFEHDLDITGTRSLQGLIDRCVSLEGSDLLRKWLTDTQPDLSATLYRQTQVKSLMPLTSLRNHLGFFLHNQKNSRLESARLHAWLSEKAFPIFKILPVLFLTLLGLCNLSLLILHLAGILPPVWIAGFIIYAILMVLRINSIQPVFQESSELEGLVRGLGRVLLYLEMYPLRSSSPLSGIFQNFQGVHSPSRDWKLLNRTLNMIGWRNNLLLGLMLNAFLPWDHYCAGLAVKCRSLFQQNLPLWIESLAQLDALSSLAYYAWLFRKTIFPEFQENDRLPLLTAKALGHPLIPEPERVSNDITFKEKGEIMLITGSNMSGKSSFLKTVGINLALAQAGGPVTAQEFSCSVFRLASCINISDSITDGYSFFYAEVRRLKFILDLLEKEGETPVLFLIDEIFKGTNNRERLIGSRSLIKKLSSSSGLGIITTHDLELVDLAHDLKLLHNFHFREHISAGKMTFDYLLRPGPCPTTNALRIMALEGLPVEVSD